MEVGEEWRWELARGNEDMMGRRRRIRRWLAFGRRAYDSKCNGKGSARHMA